MNEMEKLLPVLPAPISAILVARNTQATLESDLAAWDGAIQSIACESELIVIDDGSSDASHETLKRLVPKYPGMVLLRHETLRGFGMAVKAAIAVARHPLLVYADLNQRHKPSDLKAMLRWIDEVHLVAGMRRKSRWLRRQIFRTVFGVHMTDLSCRFILARREIFKRIPIQSKGDFAHVEVLAKANFQGCLMTEVPMKSTTIATSKETGTSIRSDALRLMRHPDFGPPDAG